MVYLKKSDISSLYKFKTKSACRTVCTEFIKIKADTLNVGIIFCGYTCTPLQSPPCWLQWRGRWVGKPLTRLKHATNKSISGLIFSEESRLNIEPKESDDCLMGTIGSGHYKGLKCTVRDLSSILCNAIMPLFTEKKYQFQLH